MSPQSAETLVKDGDTESLYSALVQLGDLSPGYLEWFDGWFKFFEWGDRFKTCDFEGFGDFYQTFREMMVASVGFMDLFLTQYVFEGSAWWYRYNYSLPSQWPGKTARLFTIYPWYSRILSQVMGMADGTALPDIGRQLIDNDMYKYLFITDLEALRRDLSDRETSEQGRLELLKAQTAGDLGQLVNAQRNQVDTTIRNQQIAIDSMRLQAMGLVK